MRTGFFKKYLEPLIEEEEKHLFPILGMQNPRVKRALANHRRLRRLFAQTTQLLKTLNSIEEELRRHVNFEQRIIFKELERKANPSDFAILKKNTKRKAFEDQVEDIFGE